MTREDLPLSNAYLWDRSGEPRADVVRLERLFAEMRDHCPIPALGPLPAVSRRRLSRVAAAGLALAATLMLALGVAALRIRLTPWTMESIEGMAMVDRQPMASAARVVSGQTIETDGRSRALLNVGVIGRVEIAPGSRVRMVVTNRWEHRLALDRGRIAVVIDAPPRWFIVDTPGAVAIDLGCAYTLDVDAVGHGTLRVDEGWVELDDGVLEAMVPAGAAAHVRQGRGPGSPYYQDAAETFQRALAVVDFGSATDLDTALSAVLAAARPRDSLTLLSLLGRLGAERRGDVYDRLAGLLPPPAGVTRQAILEGDHDALDRWWSALALPRPPKIYPRLWGFGT